MPYRRRQTRRPRTKRATRQNTMRTVARKEAYKALAKQEETKTLDGYALSTLIPNTGTLLSLHGSYQTGSFVPIVQGDSLQEYTGRNIVPKYLTLRFTTDSSARGTLSCVVIQSKGLWANTGDMANILQVTGSAAAPLSPVDSSFNNRFRMLYRKSFILDTDDPIRTSTIKLNWKKIRKIWFSDDAGTIENGHLMFGIISDHTGASPPSFNAYWRMYYKDS